MSGFDPALYRRWFPIAASTDAPPGHIFHALLLGHELALWRDAESCVHAWDNRCPHRGVRLTIGDNLGTTLRCRYHGYRFDAATARCVLMPAHPQQAAPRAMQVASHPCTEAAGLIWASLQPAGAPPCPPPGLPARAHMAIADAATLHSRLRQAGAEAQDEFTLRTATATLLLQPAAPRETWVHALLPAGTQEAALRAHDAWLRPWL